MRNLPVKSNLVDPSSEFGGNNQPLCPKPRRLGSAVPEFLKPLKCTNHSHQISDGKSVIMNLVANKTIHGRGMACTVCAPCCYTGSPPGRTANPLVNDVHFIHQMELLSPFARDDLSNNFGFTSASPM